MGPPAAPAEAHRGATPRSPRPSDQSLRIALLGGFRLLDRDRHIPIPGGSERLLAFVALRGHPDKRIVVATALWPDVPERRAYASLRSAVARLDHISRKRTPRGSHRAVSG